MFSLLYIFLCFHIVPEALIKSFTTESFAQNFFVYITVAAGSHASSS